VLDPALIALWGSRLAGYAAFANRPVRRCTWPEIRPPFFRFLVRIRQPKHDNAMTTEFSKEKGKQSIGQRIKSFLEDIATLDVLTLSGTIDLKSAASISDAALYVERSIEDALVVAAAAATDEKPFNADAAREAAIKEITKKAQSAFKAASDNYPGLKKKYEDTKDEYNATPTDGLKKLYDEAKVAFENGQLALRTAQSMLNAAKAAPTQSAPPPSVLDWDTLVAQVTANMAATKESGLKVVAYTHAEFDCDSVNFVKESPTEADKVLIANHATMVEAAQRSRFEALKYMGETIDALF